MNHDSLLNIEIEDEVLTIRIGTTCLINALSGIERFSEDFTITDQVAVLKAVIAELGREEEDGSTPVHRMLDQAFIEAVEQGCDGVEFQGVDE